MPNPPPTDPFLAFGIVAAPLATARRDQIRLTMAKYPTVAAGRTVLRFLLGSETPTLASAPRHTLHTALKLESNAHGDVLVLDAIDGARLDNACSCTEKTVAWVRHALRTLSLIHISEPTRSAIAVSAARRRRECEL